MLNVLRSLLQTKPSRERRIAIALYERIIRAARAEDLYAKAGIPDTLEGRVDSIALHAFLLFRRMSGRDGWEEVGGALSDEIVADFDRNLREMGIGDMSIGKKVKKMAQFFFSRFDAYWGAVQGLGGAEDLDQLLRRTVFQCLPTDDARVAAMLAYFDRQSVYLCQQDDAAILRG